MITKLNIKTRKILGEVHKQRIKNKKGLKRVVNYLQLNTKKKNIFLNKNCGDFGCGNHAGNAKSMLLSGAKFVHLVDISTNIIGSINKNLKKFKGKYSFKKGTVENLPFKKDFFDIINCSGVIHHTNSYQKSFKQIYKCLKKGGTAFIVVHGSGGLLTKFTMEILRKEYNNNKLVKDIMNDIMNNKTKKYLQFFKKELNNSNYKKIQKIFDILSDNDLRMTIKDRVLSPKYQLFNYKILKKYLISIGFSKMERTPIKPKFDNVRDLVAPLYFKPDYKLSKFFYGDGMLRFKLTK